MTEAIEFHNDMEIHTIYVQLGLRRFLFISLNAVSCFKHLYWSEIDTLPVFVKRLFFSNIILKFDY